MMVVDGARRRLETEHEGDWLASEAYIKRPSGVLVGRPTARRIPTFHVACPRRVQLPTIRRTTHTQYLASTAHTSASVLILGDGKARKVKVLAPSGCSTCRLGLQSSGSRIRRWFVWRSVTGNQEYGCDSISLLV